MEVLKKERIDKIKQAFEEKKKLKMAEKDLKVQEASIKFKAAKMPSRIHSVIVTPSRSKRQSTKIVDSDQNLTNVYQKEPFATARSQQ